jgi:hypothetical protein
LIFYFCLLLAMWFLRHWWHQELELVSFFPSMIFFISCVLCPIFKQFICAFIHFFNSEKYIRLTEKKLIYVDPRPSGLILIFWINQLFMNDKIQILKVQTTSRLWIKTNNIAPLKFFYGNFSAVFFLKF